MNICRLFSPVGSGLLVFLILALVYYLTMAPTMLHIDCGELAAAQYLFGIPHPTGYPLFTLLGFLFLKLPLFARPIMQANFLAVLWTAAGVGLFSSWLFKVLTLVQEVPKKKGKQVVSLPDPSSPEQAFWISVAAALVLGTTRTVWAQSNAVEVYGLQILLFSGILLTSTHAWFSNQRRDWLWVGILTGLGFSNHMTTLMILPFPATLYFHKNGFGKPAWFGLLFPALAGFGILGLLYGLMAWRAGTNPPLNWGDIHDWNSFYRHLTGHQYRTWILAGSKVAAKNLGEFFKAMPGEWAWLGLLWLVPGFKPAFTSGRWLAWAMAISVLFNLFYVSQYDIQDLEPYFLMTMMGMAWLMTFGFRVFLNRWLKGKWAFIILAESALSLGVNYQRSDQSNTRFFEEYTQTALGSVEPNALVMSQQWDFLITPYYYLRTVEGKFPDLMILDKELVRRSWYVNKQAELLDPKIFENALSERDRFLKELEPFEKDKPFVSERIEEAYQSFLGKIMMEQLKKRPVYLGIECLQNEAVRIPSGYKVIPVGFWLKLVPAGQGYVPAQVPAFRPFIPDNWKGPGSPNYYPSFIVRVWNSSCRNRAQYETNEGHPELAGRWLNAILPE